jgi:membrane associated rhomboid family serine protease
MNNNISPVVKNLIIINIIIFAGANLLLGHEMTRNGFALDGIINSWLAVHYPESEFFQPIQLLSYMFMHGSVTHILFNMLGLFMFGPPIEYIWGAKRFLFYYFFTGFGALVLDFAVKYYQIYHTNISTEDVMDLVNSPMVGASGAIFGLLAAYGYMFPNNIITPLIPPIPMKAKYFVFVYAALEIYLGISNMAQGTSNIAHFAHVGGALFGFLLMTYWSKGGRIGY